MARRPSIFARRRWFARESAREPRFHHHVYVVLLKVEVVSFRKVQKENPHRHSEKPCVYVGMSGLAPEERFTNHKQGKQASRIVRRFGVQLMPELYAHLNPMPYEAALVMEKELADDLRQQGYTVTGGH